MVKAGLCCCSIAVLGAVACASEQVRGTIDKSGNLTFTTNTGVTCSGRFVYLTTENARGIFDCGNGQSGPFDLTRSGDRWIGTGIVGNRRVVIELGHL